MGKWEGNSVRGARCVVRGARCEVRGVQRDWMRPAGAPVRICTVRLSVCVTEVVNRCQADGRRSTAGKNNDRGARRWLRAKAAWKGGQKTRDETRRDDKPTDKATTTGQDTGQREGEKQGDAETVVDRQRTGNPESQARRRAQSNHAITQ